MTVLIARLPVDIPGLIRGASSVYEYPMVDRDPIDPWTGGAVSLIGDAAHAAKYMVIAGISIDELNALPPATPAGARL